MLSALEWVRDNGIPLRSSYRDYSGFQGQCDAFDSAYSVGGYVYLPQYDPLALKTALNQQPVAVGVAVNNRLQFYSWGVIDRGCGEQVNHGVVAVGYGHDELTNLDYWLIKNQWGEEWGEEGYARIKRTDEEGLGECAILYTS